MTPTEQIARLREIAQLRALQRMPTSIRDQTKRAAFVRQTHREELAKRQPQIDWLERKLARGTALLIVGLLSLATAHAQQPWGRPYTPPAQYQPPVSQVRPWLPPALPPGSPSLMIPMPAPTPPPAPWPGYRP